MRAMGGNGAFFGAVAAHIKRSSWPAPTASRGAKGERLQQVKAALGLTSDSFLPTQVETNLFVKRGGGGGWRRRRNPPFPRKDAWQSKKGRKNSRLPAFLARSLASHAGAAKSSLGHLTLQAQEPKEKSLPSAENQVFGGELLSLRQGLWIKTG